MQRVLAVCAVFATAVWAAIGCSDHTGMTSAIAVRLVDAPFPDVSEIVVTIDEVSAHVAGGGWVTLANQQATVDLLSLQGGTFALLGVTQLPAGKITQMRLHVVPGGLDYVTTSADGAQHPLITPSGEESGIKIIGGFSLRECDTGNITLDFDGKNSIFTHPTGSGDEWILRPVIRVKSVQATVDCSDGGTGGGGTGGTGGGGAGGGGGGGGDSDGTDGGGGSGGGGGGGVPIQTGNPDPCANVTCSTGQICYNGSCTDLIP
jgi:hypothetical protein